MKYKKLYIFITFLLLFAFNIPNVLGQQFNFQQDFLNLEQELPQFFEAYSKIKIKESWNAVNNAINDGEQLYPVKIGILDSGIDVSNGRHVEFRNVNLGNTPLKTDSEPLGHGTQVAGIIGANNVSFPDSSNYELHHMNGILSGVHGLDYTLEMRGEPVVSFPASLPIFGLSSKLRELKKEEVQVVNMSFSSKVLSGQIEFLTKSYERLFNKNRDDILFVVAAGGPERLFGFDFGAANAELVAPANLGDNLQNVITVGATTLSDERASFSNFGSAVNIAAPGVSVFTPAPRGRGDMPLEDYENEFFGTSAAAPFVTGVAGLLKAIDSSLTPAEIKNILIETGDTIDTDEPIGPRLNALRAVNSVLPAQGEVFEVDYTSVLEGTRTCAELLASDGWDDCRTDRDFEVFSDINANGNFLSPDSPLQNFLVKRQDFKWSDSNFTARLYADIFSNDRFTGLCLTSEVVDEDNLTHCAPFSRDVEACHVGKFGADELHYFVPGATEPSATSTFPDGNFSVDIRYNHASESCRFITDSVTVGVFDTGQISLKSPFPQTDDFSAGAFMDNGGSEFWGLRLFYYETAGL